MIMVTPQGAQDGCPMLPEADFQKVKISISLNDTMDNVQKGYHRHLRGLRSADSHLLFGCFLIGQFLSARYTLPPPL